MSERLFTVTQASEVSEMEGQTIRNLIAEGVLRPAARRGDPGAVSRRGDPHLLSFVQVVALALADRMRREGAEPSRWRGVAHYLSRMPEEKLGHHIRKGETCVVPTSLIVRAMREAGRPQVLLPGMMVRPDLSDPGLTPD